MISYEDFAKVDIRVGTVLSAEELPKARKPALKLVVDFGSHIGTKKTSAQITHLYSEETLVGRQVLAVVNFPPKQIGSFMSEVLASAYEYSQANFDEVLRHVNITTGLSTDTLRDHYNLLDYYLDSDHFHGLEYFVRLSKIYDHLPQRETCLHTVSI